MYDKDIFKTDDDLGYAMVPLAGLGDSVDQDLDIPLQGEGEAQRRFLGGCNSCFPAGPRAGNGSFLPMLTSPSPSQAPGQATAARRCSFASASSPSRSSRKRRSRR